MLHVYKDHIWHHFLNLDKNLEIFGKPIFEFWLDLKKSLENEAFAPNEQMLNLPWCFQNHPSEMCKTKIYRVMDEHKWLLN